MSELWAAFDGVMAIVRGDTPAAPCMAKDGAKPMEYSFLPLTQYGVEALIAYPDTGTLLDAFSARAIRKLASNSGRPISFIC